MFIAVAPFQEEILRSSLTIQRLFPRADSESTIAPFRPHPVGVHLVIIKRNRLLVLALTGLLAMAFRSLAEQPPHATPTPRLGAVEFPTSGNPEAQRHFLRGVAAMHSFWYEEALNAFRKSTTTQPDFAMGYWGEAMAHNHPIWKEQDLEAARSVLAKIPRTGKMTPREKAYLSAVRILYGPGDKLARDKAYAANMGQLYRKYPEDLEAACFYSLALLGTVRHGDRGTRTHIQAGAIALEIFRKNPDHPCAAHYAIHAFDDPDHAILALPAARRYAQIAPAAHHAQHMPAHIFVQLGMWSEAAASNEAGWKDSVAWVTRNNLPINLRDYHSLYWLHYTYLQQGRYKDAKDILDLKREDMKQAGTDPQSQSTGYDRKVSRYYHDMVAAYILETQQWEVAGSLIDQPGQPASDEPDPLSTFTLGFAVARAKQPGAMALLDILDRARERSADKTMRVEDKLAHIWQLELAAAIQFSAGNMDGAVAKLREAVELEETLPPPSGPPGTIKPPHEFLGEVLLETGHLQEAESLFRTALYRHPKRARSLLGRARAIAKIGDTSRAVRAYQHFLTVWAQADDNLPELLEAEQFLQRFDKAGETRESAEVNEKTK